MFWFDHFLYDHILPVMLFGFDRDTVSFSNEMRHRLLGGGMRNMFIHCGSNPSMVTWQIILSDSPWLQFNNCLFEIISTFVFLLSEHPRHQADCVPSDGDSPNDTTARRRAHDPVPERSVTQQCRVTVLSVAVLSPVSVSVAGVA